MLSGTLVARSKRVFNGKADRPARTLVTLTVRSNTDLYRVERWFDSTNIAVPAVAEAVSAPVAVRAFLAQGLAQHRLVWRGGQSDGEAF